MTHWWNKIALLTRVTCQHQPGNDENSGGERELTKKWRKLVQDWAFWMCHEIYSLRQLSLSEMVITPWWACWFLNFRTNLKKVPPEPHMKLAILIENGQPFRIWEQNAKKLSSATVIAVAEKVSEKWLNFKKCIFNTRNKKDFLILRLEKT